MYINHGLSELQDHINVSRDASLINIEHSVRLNRQFAQSLGWQDYRERILKLLGLPATANETAFAEAVARWQRSKKISRNGIIGPDTWFRMQLALGILDPPFPRRPLDGNQLANLIFYTNHPELHLAPIQAGQAVLKQEWNQLHDRLILPALRQAPLCEASGPDYERLADYLRWLNGELTKKTPDAKRIGYLKHLVSLQVKVFVQSMGAYIKGGCGEPNLETLRLLIQALPWTQDKDVQAQRALLINSIWEAQKNSFGPSNQPQKQCKGSGILRIEVRKPSDFSKSFTKDAGQAALASAAIQIFVPKAATEVAQLEWLHARLEWICPHGKTPRSRSGGERGVHRILWTVREGEKSPCPLNIAGTERLACDGHIYGLAVMPGSKLLESAEKKGFEMDKCEWEFVETFRAITSAYSGINPLGRCRWGFQFIARQSIAANGQLIRQASVKYTGVDKELVSP